MDFRRLKELVGKLGGLLVFDGDEPSLVVLSYDKFKKLDVSEEIPVSHRNGFDLALEGDVGLKYGQDIVNGVQEDDATTVEKLNQEISALKEEIRQKEEAELIESDQPMETMADPVDLD